ncbi:cardioactive peptide isoform X1 [Anastrepha obliqua]|uniref:cardioactive peptide-like isoform X1 n=1 Tax=Anastrepha ludens TaxID=28586 RepID=UPI0023AEEAA3|nr:cardioactive peptide-like isoform X1 [Anastrepha ludens]XP_054747607.1 cardioactive peptide isoform X1 [Anastrepha obliqua]
MLAWKVWSLVGLLCVHSALQIETDNNFLNHKLSGIIQWKYEKRPFCNAFTGCGKKRSSLPPYPLWKRAEMDEAKTYNNEEMSEGLSDLIDINAEPAVENVQKQIMSQAKIFEAIKEASKEIFRQKNKQKMRQREEVQDNTEGV